MPYKNLTDLSDVASYLSGAVHPRVDWEKQLCSDIGLRIFFGMSVVLSNIACAKCDARTPAMAIHGDQICVDADYFIEMDGGHIQFQYTDIEKIASMPSSPQLDCYALCVTEIQDGFIEQLAIALTGDGVPSFYRSLRYGIEDGTGLYANSCVACGHIMAENDLFGRGSAFHPACPGELQHVLRPGNGQPLILRGKLKTVGDMR